jgi:hypothetical protein
VSGDEGDIAFWGCAVQRAELVVSGQRRELNHALLGAEEGAVATEWVHNFLTQEQQRLGAALEQTALMHPSAALVADEHSVVDHVVLVTRTATVASLALCPLANDQTACLI